MKADFEMLIPHYNDEVDLSELLHDIIDTNDKHKPNSIHIVNDGESSDDFIKICTEYSKYLPIRIYEVEHVGHIKLIHDFMMSTDAENVLISHSDVKLKCNNANLNYYDPVSVLGFYISDNNISGISCYSLSSGRGLHKQVSKSDAFISYGLRTLDNKNAFGTLYAGFKASFPLRETFGEFQRCLSFDDKFYALNSTIFKSVGGFGDSYFDYLYYLDDYFGRCRMKAGSHCIFTNQTAVKHEVRESKPEGSKAFNNNEKYQLFYDFWSGNNFMNSRCLREEDSKSEDIRVN